MSIPGRAILAAQSHCLSVDGLTVLTAQQWADPAPASGQPTSWLRLVRNGVARQDVRFAGPRRQEEMRRVWSDLVDRYRPTALTEEQMRSKLLELAGVALSRCGSGRCPGLLPVAWPYCPECGRHESRVASGALSGTRARGPILWDLRETPKG